MAAGTSRLSLERQPWLVQAPAALPCTGVYQGETQWLLRGVCLHSSQHPCLAAFHLPDCCGVHGESYGLHGEEGGRSVQNGTAELKHGGISYMFLYLFIQPWGQRVPPPALCAFQSLAALYGTVSVQHTLYC